ncbi:hypothetical protein CBL_01974 [Carabus blaptoides fortunei]
MLMKLYYHKPKTATLHIRVIDLRKFAIITKIVEVLVVWIPVYQQIYNYNGFKVSVGFGKVRSVVIEYPRERFWGEEHLSTFQGKSGVASVSPTHLAEISTVTANLQKLTASSKRTGHLACCVCSTGQCCIPRSKNKPRWIHTLRILHCKLKVTN